MNTPAVSIEELSRYLDGEVTPEEQADIETRLATCPVSQRLLERLREVTKEIGEAISEQSPVVENAPTLGCLDDDTLIRMADNQLNPAEYHRVEAHAASCTYCLRRISECVRSAVSMEVSNWKKLPAKLRSDPRLAPLKNVKPRPRKIDPGDAIRGEIVCPLGMRQRLTRVFPANGYGLQVSIAPQRDGLANIELSAVFDGQPKAQAELLVVVSGTDTKVFRGTTSLDGRILIRRLHAGAYDIFFSAANLMVTAKMPE